jgi:hypothetical protein
MLKHPQIVSSLRVKRRVSLDDGFVLGDWGIGAQFSTDAIFILFLLLRPTMVPILPLFQQLGTYFSGVKATYA